MSLKGFFGNSKLSKELIAAATNGNLEIAKDLLQKGADIEAKDKDDYTPLILASTYGHLDIVDLLIKNGCNINGRSEHGVTAIICAAENGRAKIVEHLLLNGADLSIKTTEDLTPLSQATSQGHDEVVTILLDHGADINESRDDFKTPLMVAAMDGYNKIVDILITREADVNATTENNETALFWASNMAIIKSLIDAGASTEISTIDGSTPLFLAYYESHEEVVQFWLDKGVQVNAVRKDVGSTALQAAVLGARDRADLEGQVVRKLLDCGADPNLSGGVYYPIHIAAQGGLEKIVAMLIEAGADINMRAQVYNEEDFPEYCGHTPLMIATAKGKENVVKILVENGADIDLSFDKDNDMDTSDAIFCAEHAGHKQIVKYLRKASGKKWWNL